MTSPSTTIVPETDDLVDEDRPWQVVVWDDPVNTMTFVVYVFRKLFGYSEKKATKLMLQVHNEGRAAVSEGPREKVEIECYQLHSFGLWATIEQQDG
jgi:ATP-dependent Clp protease adaptor protein ClpS